MHARVSPYPLTLKVRQRPLVYNIQLRTVSRKLGRLKLALIDVDRTPTKRILPLVAHLARGGSVPPIKVKKLSGGRYRVLDGRHRILAAKLLGWDTIFARWAEDTRIPFMSLI